MIVFYHLAELVKLPVPDGLNIIKTHFGMGVPLFYVLSGFVLSYGYAGKLNSQARILTFYVRRFFRIAPLFYCMLILWCLTSYFGWGKIFSSQTIFLNIFFLFGLVPGYQESIVWAGWSIGVEMLFYLVFPVISCLFPGVRSAAAGLFVSLVLSAAIYNSFDALGAGSYAYMNLGTHLPFFLAGVLSFRIWEKSGFSSNPAMGWKLLLCTLALCVVLMTWQAVPVFLAKLRFGALDRNVWAFIFGAIVLSACLAKFRFLDTRWLLRTGNWSYSVYILHPFLMLLMIKTNVMGQLVAYSENEYVLFVLGAAIALTAIFLTSAITYRWIEHPGMKYGQRVASFIQTNNGKH